MAKKMGVKQLLLQAINYALFMGLVGYLSFQPPYHHIGADQAVVTLAFGHAGRPISECIRRTPEELAKLPPNMRKPIDCPRQRSPVTLELRLDDERIVRDVFEAPGFYNDQGIDVYIDTKVTAGDHRLAVWLNDDINAEGATYELEKTVTLNPAQLLVIGFDSNMQGFTLK